MKLFKTKQFLLFLFCSSTTCTLFIKTIFLDEHLAPLIQIDGFVIPVVTIGLVLSEKSHADDLILEDIQRLGEKLIINTRCSLMVSID